MPDTVLCIDVLHRLWGWCIRQICLCTCSHSSALLQMWVIIYVENDSERIRETRRCLQLIARTPASAGSRIFLHYDTVRATDSSNECKSMQSRSKKKNHLKSVELCFFCVTDGSSSRRQHDGGDRPKSKNGIFPDRLRHLPRFHWRLCDRLRADKWVLHILKYTAAPARHLYFVFQRRCLRCQISVSLRRVCSLCVWAGRPLQGRLMVSRSSSQNVR